MDNDYYFPNAFFAFRLNINTTKYPDLLKYNVRNIIANEAKEYLTIRNAWAITPWKINLFRIEEFEPYNKKDPEAMLKLKQLNGRDPFKSLEMSYMSSFDITVTHHNARLLLNDHPHARMVVEKAKEMNLNYIIHTIYEDTSLIRVNYRDDAKAYEALTGIVARLSNTEIVLHNKDFNKQFYAYTKDNELQIVNP